MVYGALFSASLIPLTDLSDSGGLVLLNLLYH